MKQTTRKISSVQVKPERFLKFLKELGVPVTNETKVVIVGFDCEHVNVVLSTPERGAK
jgi:hypothetical protein